MRRTLPVVWAVLLVGAACTSPHGPKVVFSGPLTAFHIVYRVEDRAAGHRTASTVNWWVRRPFDGRREVRAGAALGGRLLSLEVTSFGRSLVHNTGNAALVLAVPPQPPAGDLRFDRVDPQVMRRWRRSTRTVAGRACQVLRLATSTANGGLLGARPTDHDHTDVCVDGRYLVLARTDVAGGKVVHDEKVVSLRVGSASVRDDLFTTPAPTLDLPHGSGFIRPVDPASRPPGVFYELTAPPGGYRLKGRYATAPPQPENYRTDDPTTRAARVAGVADVYTKGPDMIVVDRGGTLGGVAPFAADPSPKRIDVADLGAGELIESLLVSNARIALPDGHYLRVVGTAPSADVIDLLRALRPQPGGELVYLDGP